MASYEEVMSALRKADARAQQGDTQAAEDAKKLANIAKRLKGQSQRTPLTGNQGESYMGQVNAGIADTIGGLADFINPFDNPVWQGTPVGMGSAREGLASGMRGIGADVATQEPQTVAEGLARGTGHAAGAMLPVGGGLATARGAGGVIGGAADDAYRAMASRGGAVAELGAGASGGAAGQAVEQAGYPEWAPTAEIIGGMGPAAAITAGRYTPTAIGARAVGNRVAKEVAPYTEVGARGVARDRMQELAGGPERARELAGRVTNDNPLGLTPAQQTADPNMLAIEQAAMDTDPNVRVSIEGKIRDADTAARDILGDLGGDVRDARSFIDQRRQQAKQRISSHIQWARAKAQSQRPRAQRSEADNSLRVADQIREAEGRALAEEKTLWNAVPKGASVGTDTTREVVDNIFATTPRTQRTDIPDVLRQFFREGANEPWGETETVAEMHGLYSELRRVARAASAGQAPNKNLARLANTAADAVLQDLGAVDATTDIGRAINTARAYSAEMHETFDRGTVGKLLNRTIDGDETINPQLTLERSIGRGGVTGEVGRQDITRAAGDRVNVPSKDYLVSRFNRAAVEPDGSLNVKRAQTFMRDSAEVLEHYPELRDTFDRAIQAQTRAVGTEARVGDRLKALDSQQSAGARFLSGSSDQAAKSILDSDDPARTAAEIVRQARKDESGKALAGVKGALVDELMRRSLKPQGEGNILGGQNFMATVNDPRMKAAMGRIFNPGEQSRLNRLGSELVKVDTARKAAPDIGNISQATPNRVIEILARFVAARNAAKAGQGSGASLQLAGMASERMKRILGGLTNDRAAKIMIDAVEDPELFRTLLLEPKSAKVEARIRSKLAPYLTGAAATQSDEEPLRMDINTPRGGSQ